MWRLSNKPRTYQVTKALAKEFAEMEPVPRDRPLSERRLQVYARLLNEGAFRPVTWAKAVCKETGGVYRVNGKHTSILLSGLKVMPEFYVTVEEYACDNLDDVAHLYSTFDSRMQSRTAGDINASFAGTVPELREMSLRTINASVAGMGWHIWQGNIGTTQAAERAELILEHPEFVLWLSDLLGSGASGSVTRSRHLARQGTVAAMFATYQKAKGPATTFWEAVRDETGDKPEFPDRKLARYLLTHVADRGRGVSRLKIASTREMYVKSLHAWNAWRRNETTNLNYYPEADVPSVK